MCARQGITAVDAFTKRLLPRLTERGYQGRIISIHHLAELQEEIKERAREREDPFRRTLITEVKVKLLTPPYNTHVRRCV